MVRRCMSYLSKGTLVSRILLTTLLLASTILAVVPFSDAANAGPPYNAFTETGRSRPIYGNVSPQAYYYNGVTYVVWQGTDFAGYIDAYDHASGTWDGAVKVADSNIPGGWMPDSHGAPMVLVDNGGTIHVFGGCHGQPMYHATSDNPEDISAWTEGAEIGTNPTYPHGVKIAAGTLYVFFRHSTASGDLRYVQSGAWAVENTIVSVDVAGDDAIYSSNVAYDSVNGRLHVVWTHRDGSDGGEQLDNLYHAYLKLADGHMYDMAGNDLGVTVSYTEAETNCKIVSYTAFEGMDYSSTVHLDSNNYPHIVYGKKVSVSQRVSIYYQKWSGAAWSSEYTIATSTNVSWKRDFIITSVNDIDCYVPRQDTGLEKYNFDGSTWSLESTIMPYYEFPVTGCREATTVIDGVDGLCLVFSDFADNADTTGLEIYAIDSTDTFLGTAGGGGFPNIIDVTSGTDAVDQQNHSVDLFASISANDLLLVYVSADNNATTIGFPAGWTQLFHTPTTGAGCVLGAWYRVADGEEGASITVTTDTNQMISFITYQITDYAGVPECGTATEGASADAPDPPSLSPSWGEMDTLWFATTGWDWKRTISAYPANYADGLYEWIDDDQGVGVAAAVRNNETATEDPGTFTLSGNTSYIANTIAIRGELQATIITTTEAIDVTMHEATIGGQVTATGGDDPTIMMFWGETDGGTDPNFWDSSSAPDSPAQPQGVAAFILGLTGLDRNTTYYFSARGVNDAGTVWGTTRTFSTPLSLTYSYRALLAVTENSSNSYPMLPVLWDQNNSWLANQGFMSSDALDTRIETLAGSDKPWLVSDNATLTAIPVPADSRTNLYFVTGEDDATAMNIIVGYGGYITRADDADWEAADDFSLEWLEYFDVTASDIALSKNGAISVTRDTGDMLASIWGAEDKEIFYEGSNDGASVIYGVNWYAQTFTTTAAVTITKVGLHTQRFSTPGDITVSIRAVDEEYKPTGADLTSGAVSANGWDTSMAWNDVDVTDYLLTASTQYAIVVRVLGGDGANNVAWSYDNTSPSYADGSRCTSGDSGSTWSVVAAHDHNFRVYGNTVDLEITASGVSAGEHEFAVYADGSTFYIDVDGSTEDSVALGGSSVLDNSNAWVFYPTTYWDYYHHYVSDTLVGWYQPNAIILTTVLPDREGDAENGVITWGSNPAGVDVALGGLTSASQPSLGGDGTTDTTDILPVTGDTDWRPTPGISATLTANPLRPIIVAISDNTTLSEYQVWVWLGIIFVVFITVLVGANVRGHHTITGVAAGATIVLLVVWTVFPPVSLIAVILAIWGGHVSERSPTL